MKLCRGIACAWMGLVSMVAWPALGETAQTQTQEAVLRAQIQAERDATAWQKQQDEALCYQRFAVEDCLEQVRRQHRQHESRLRRQEVQLNEVRRQEREAERLQTLRASQADAAKQPPAAVQTHVRKPCDMPDCQDKDFEREQQAKVRAQAHQKQVQAHAVQVRHREVEREQQAVAARERQARLQAEVLLQRERRLQEQAQAAAQGKKPAAPLPQTPPSGTP